MIALYLLAAHMVGDYVLQTRWQAAGKFIDRGLRARHVAAYALPFVPIAVVFSPDWRYALAFMLDLVFLHFLTDSRRFLSTLGDWIVWTATALHYRDFYVDVRGVHPAAGPIEPGPWPPLPILIDQTLHVCQLAVLGGIFLS